MAGPGLCGRPSMRNPPTTLRFDYAPQKRRSLIPFRIQLKKLVGAQAISCVLINHNKFRLKQRRGEVKDGTVRTNEEDETFGRGSEARSDGIDAVDNGSLEIDVENAEHVNGVEDDS